MNAPHRSKRRFARQFLHRPEPPRPRKFLRVVSPSYVAGAIFERQDGIWRAVHTAPILGWMRNRLPNDIQRDLELEHASWFWSPLEPK